MIKGEVKSFWDEEWKDMVFDNTKPRSRYKISNYGRILSFYYKEEGQLLSSTTISGYKVFVIKDKEGKNIRQYVHRLVAKYFLDEPTDGRTQVLHHDNNKGNNYYKNLFWANEKEKRAHQDKMTPGWHQWGNVGRRKYAKLTESQVKLIKRKINDPNRKTRMKIIAKRYGVSVMQLYRIKTGENWSSVKAD